MPERRKQGTKKVITPELKKEAHKRRVEKLRRMVRGSIRKVNEVEGKMIRKEKITRADADGLLREARQLDHHRRQVLRRDVQLYGGDAATRLVQDEALHAFNGAYMVFCRRLDRLAEKGIIPENWRTQTGTIRSR